MNEIMDLKTYKNHSVSNDWRIFTSRSVKNEVTLFDEQNIGDYVGQTSKYACANIYVSDDK